MSIAGATDEHSIRAMRARSNLSIANQDIEGIAGAWMDDITVLGSTSVQLHGAPANRAFYLAQFARRPDTVWVRTPSAVRVMAAWGVALEEGDWSGAWTEPDGQLALSGRYMAQWVRADRGWRIQGELYVATTCKGGAYCSGLRAVAATMQLPEQ